MLKRKTPTRERQNYHYNFCNPEFGGTDSATPSKLIPGVGGITEYDIKLAHSLDDAEVYNNLKNWKAPLTEKEKAERKEWEEKHPGEELEKNWHISMDGLQRTDNVDTSSYMKQIQNLAAEQNEDPMRECLYECLEEMGEEAKMLYELRFRLGYTQEKIAKVLDVSQMTVSKHLKKLTDELTVNCREKMKKS